MFANILIINICYHDNLHACKGTRRVLFLRYLQERHLLGRSRTQLMYFRQKDADFQLH